MAAPPDDRDLGALTATAVRLLRMSHFTIEQAPVGVLWVDADGAIRRVNTRGSALLGRSREALSQMRFQALLGGDGAAASFADLWRAGQDAAPYVGELDLLRGDATTLPAEVAVSYVDFDGRPHNCVFIHDISERRVAEGALREALEEVQRFKDRLQAENVYLRDEIRSEHGFEEIVGSSPALQAMLSQLQQVAPSEASVLIQGESGTGKELVARAIHARSGRHDRPLVKVNCAALPEHLIESELFGHERGAFTGAVQRRTGRFELAHQGTIFLDEIGELPLGLQPKLLRVLQEGEYERIGDARTRHVDVRVIAATNRDLSAAVADGSFRADLYYRLNVVPIDVPPLRQRAGDIGTLAAHFAAKYASRQGAPAPVLPQAMLEQMRAYGWPGNVRELQNVVERAVILSSGPLLQLAQPLPGAVGPADEPTTVGPPEDPDGQPTMREVEVHAIRRALDASGWVVGGKAGAARLLDMPPSTLRERIARYAIVRDSS